MKKNDEGHPPPHGHMIAWIVLMGGMIVVLTFVSLLIFDPRFNYRLGHTLETIKMQQEAAKTEKRLEEKKVRLRKEFQNITEQKRQEQEQQQQEARAKTSQYIRQTYKDYDYQQNQWRDIADRTKPPSAESGDP